MVDITEISAIVAAAGVLVGVVYYVLEIRQQTKIRQTDLIMRLYSVFGSPEFGESALEVFNAESADFDYYVKSSKDASNKTKLAARTQAAFFEGVGVLPHRKLIDIELVDDLLSSPITQMWEELEPKIKVLRERSKRHQIWEWFEYLYNEMKKREQKLQ